MYGFPEARLCPPTEEQHVVVPAFCDIPLGSVGQQSGPASTCAAADLLADVSALTSAHTVRSHGAHARSTVEAAYVEPIVSANKHTKQPDAAEPRRETRQIGIAAELLTPPTPSSAARQARRSSWRPVGSAGHGHGAGSGKRRGARSSTEPRL